MNRVSFMRRLAAVLLFSITLTACNDDETARTAVIDWNAFASELIASNQLLPPEQTRALAIVQIAVHDALNAIEPRYFTYVYESKARGASAPAAIAAATRVALLAVLPATLAPQIEAKYTEAIESIPEGTPKQAGIAIGEAAATAITQARANDGYGPALTKPYTPPAAAPGAYQLTPPLNLVLAAGLGDVPLFALETAGQFRSSLPPSVNSAGYTQDYAEVKAFGADVSGERTETQTETAMFWYDAATREWHSAARQGFADAHVDAWRAARVLAAMSIAMADAVVASMDTKFKYEFWRPITAIRAGEHDGNDATTGDEHWTPLCVTPPFPEYNSTHAATAAAAARVLARALGDAHSIVIDSPTLVGKQRTFASFSAAADEEALSRVYCGIHFRDGMNAGLEQGSQIADFVLDTVLTRRDR